MIFTEIRTDLALEMREKETENAARRDAGEIDGVVFSEKREGNVCVSVIDVINENGSEKLGKPRGRYVTVAFGDVSGMTYGEYERICGVLAENILSLAKRAAGDVKSVLVCGLGNRRFSADAVGVISAEKTVVTRHVKNSDEKLFEAAGFFDICAIMPGVAAQTGIETLELVRSAANEAKPDLIIVVDALAARKAERLGCTVQLTDTGISPGSGVGNCRGAINKDTTGVPTVAVGVPTVIDSGTLIRDMLDEAGASCDIKIPCGMFVCPKDVDVKAELVGSMIGYAINLAFHKNMSIPEMMIM